MLASSIITRRSFRRFPDQASNSMFRQISVPRQCFPAHSSVLLNHDQWREPIGRSNCHDFLRSSTRCFSQDSQSLPTRTSQPGTGSRGGNDNEEQQDIRSRNTNPNSSEKSVQRITKRILSLGDQAKNSGTNTSGDLLALEDQKLFWAEADQAIQWWTKQGTAESVELSFRLLDALADLSMIAQPPQLSSSLLNSKTLNQLVKNWFVALAKKERNTISTTEMFSKLEKYRINSRNTSATRRKLRPDPETYQILMEATAQLSNTQTIPAGYNESIVRHLMEQGKDDPGIRPDMKTVAHILHGWSARGQAVPPEELKSVLALLKGFHVADKTLTDNRGDAGTTVELFNEALFALARGNSMNKDTRRAEKMLSILNFMILMESEYDDDTLNVSPNEQSYNLVLNAFARAGKGAQAEMILRHWVDRYIEAARHEGSGKKTAKPDCKSFTIVITAFGNSEENHAAEKAEGILRWQHQLNTEDALKGCVPPDRPSYNSVIRAWSLRRSEKGVDRCDRLREEMIQHKLSPDLQTYRQSLKAVAISNLPEKGRRAVQLWREMEFRGIEADVHVRSCFEKCVALSAQKLSSPRRQLYRKKDRDAGTTKVNIRR